ncbi:hypothetical protein PIB30_088026 [Stylosanthes scabra]|uniref:Zinc knuckle CX2CX4HX4C domain-containing protein n=1 Tax=Stylosanthes scabra TaxID=79078 RepID=A0ABU6UTU0_9FABA|nr:hypothetical protein [Stylosanthes scabra]
MELMKKVPWSIRGANAWVPLSYMNRLIIEKLGRAIGPNLPRIWIKLKYERILDGYCLNCGRIGHNKKNRNSPNAAAKWDPLKPRYSHGLGTSRPPPLSDVQELEVQVELEDSDDSTQP